MFIVSYSCEIFGGADMRFKNKVHYCTLQRPFCIAVLRDNDGATAKPIKARLDELMKKLDANGIKFAAVDHKPPIIVSVETRDVEAVKQLGIKIP